MPDTKGIGTFVNDEHELATDSIDLFSIPQAEVSIVHGKDVIYFPSSNFNADGNFEFFWLMTQMNLPCWTAQPSMGKLK